MMNIVRSVSLGALSLGVLACHADAPDTNVVTSDSAGVEIVANTIGTSHTCSLNEPPTFEFGALEGPGVLEHVTDIGMMSDGAILIADRLASNVKVLDSRGGYSHSIGRQGEGPGEFRRIVSLTVINDTTFAVLDRFTRLVYFTRDGRFTGYWAPEQPYPNTHLVSAFSDGTVIVATECCTPPSPGFAQRNLIVIVHDTAGSVVDTVARFQSRRLAPLAQTRPPIYVQPLFEPRANVTLMGDTIIAADGRFPEFRIYDRHGRLLRIVRWNGSDRRITSADVSANREKALSERARSAADTSLIRRSTGKEQELNTIFPELDSLIVSATGQVWVREYPRPKDENFRWRAFSKSGRHVCDMLLPTNTRPYAVSDRDVLLLVLDELDVPYLRSFTFSEPQRSSNRR